MAAAGLLAAVLLSRASVAAPPGPPGPMVDVEIGFAPADTMVWGDRAGWSIRRQRFGGGSPLVDVDGVAVARSGRCPAAIDDVRLARFRANGFRLIRFDVQASAPPSGKYQRVAPAQVRLKDANLQPTYDPSKANYLVVEAPIERVPPFMGVGSCHSGYRLRLWMTGPKNIDPATGRTLATPRVN